MVGTEGQARNTEEGECGGNGGGGVGIGKEKSEKEGSAKKKRAKMWLDPKMNALVKAY